MKGGGDPAIVIDGAMSPRFEILRGARLRGIGIGEGGAHVPARHGQLSETVHGPGCRYPGTGKNGRGNVDGMLELGAQPSSVGDALGPGNDKPVSRAAKVRRHPLHPLKRRRACPCPADRVVVFMQRVTDFIELGDLRFDAVGDAVLGHHVVERAVQAAFGTRPVVTGNKNDQRIVGVGQCPDGVDQAPCFMIGLCEKPGKRFLMACIQPLRVCTQ
ncbi:hypothetical protein D3C81_1355710 [compost metagenome]